VAERSDDRPDTPHDSPTDDGATTKETETVSTETVSTETVSTETADAGTVSVETAETVPTPTAAADHTAVTVAGAGADRPAVAAADLDPAPAGWVPPQSAWPDAAIGALPAASTTDEPPAPRRRGPDVLTLFVGLATLVMAVFAFVGELPDLSGFDPRWLLASGAALVGLVLLVNSLRSRTGGRRSG
jgi:hypothetical protein